MRVWCGVDLGSRHSRVSVVDGAGRQLENFLISNDAAGVALIAANLRAHTRAPRREITIALEDRSGLIPCELLRLGYRVVPIHPVAVARYRSSLATSGTKSDRYDALVLANLIRLEKELHRPLPHDSDLVSAIRTLTRAHQEQVWMRVGIQSQIYGLLILYHPGVMDACRDLVSPEARAVLELAPTPAAALRLRPATVERALVAAGRKRGAAARAADICAALRHGQLRQSPLTEAAMGRQALTLLQGMNEAIARAQQLEDELKDLYKQHRFWPVFTSFPGLSGVLGARILGEFGDDPTRFRRPSAIQALAGTRPITKQSGGQLLVQRRLRYNRRLGNAVVLWMMPLRNSAPEARAYYQRRRERGERHGTAVRNLANKYLAFLAACVRTDSLYDADRAAASLSGCDN